jgi:dephospho-CoA kinase
MVQRLRPLIVGLTGGFGTGKSTVAEFFRQCGAEVLDADFLAHEALSKKSPVYPKIAAAFKEAVCPKTGRLRKARIAGIIFKNPRRRKRIEALIHPYVLKRMKEAAERSGARVVVWEVPLLFETGFDRECDCTVTVRAREEDAEKRLRQKGFSLPEIEARRLAQWPLAKKVEKANAVIDNSGKPEETKRQVRRLWKELCAVANKEKT